jgi:hypothetical protein
MSMSEVVEAQVEHGESTPDVAAISDARPDEVPPEDASADQIALDQSPSEKDEPSEAQPPPKPQDLRSLVMTMGRWRKAPTSDTFLILLSPTAALPQAKRSDELDAQICKGVAKVVAKRRGVLYRTSDSDLAVLVRTDAQILVSIVRDLKISLLRGIEYHCPSSFGCIDQNRMVAAYDLSNAYQQAASRISRYAAQEHRASEEGEGEAQDDLRSLSDDDARKVMMAYKDAGAEKFAKSFIRHQPIILTESNRPVKTVMNEYFVSINELRKPFLADVELRGSGQAFNEFTLMLDQIVLRAFNDIGIAPGPFSINLNVQTVFTKVFKAFLEEVPRQTMANMTFEFRQPDVVEFFDSFVTARDLIRAKGGRIAIDRIFPDTLGLVDLGYLGATMGKVHWRNGADEAFLARAEAVKYMLECGVQPVMIRVDDHRGLEIGAKLGIQRFQGFHIDSIMRQGALH